jgi:hypothetical protein
MFHMPRRLRIGLLVLSGIATFLILFMLGLYAAARYEPPFYRKALETDPAELEKHSDRMLQQIAAISGMVKKKGHWEVLFTADQINGWLAVDRAKNHPRSLPPTMRDPRVVIESNQITFACRYELNGIGSVLSLTIEPSFLPETNTLALRIVGARAGVLPAPLSPVLDRISEAARNMKLRLKWGRAGGDPVAMLPLPSTGKDRSVSIETLRLEDGEIYVAGTTEPINSKGNHP